MFKQLLQITFRLGVPTALLPITYVEIIPSQEVNVVAGARMEVHYHKVGCIWTRQLLPRAVNVRRIGGLISQSVAKEDTVGVSR